MVGSSSISLFTLMPRRRAISFTRSWVCHDARILGEYRQVLLRPAFPFSRYQVESILDQIEADGVAVAALPLARRLPDPDDEAFLEVALAGAARFLVTGTLRHYPGRRRQGVRVVSPRDFLGAYLQSSA